MGGGGMPPALRKYILFLFKLLSCNEPGAPQKAVVYHQVNGLAIVSGHWPPLSVGFAASSPKGRAKLGAVINTRGRRGRAPALRTVYVLFP